MERGTGAWDLAIEPILARRWGLTIAKARRLLWWRSVGATDLPAVWAGEWCGCRRGGSGGGEAFNAVEAGG